MDERGASDVGTVIPTDLGSEPLGTTEGSATWASEGQSGGVKEQAANAAASAKDVAATTSGEARQVAGTAAEGAREVAKETGRQVGEVAGEAATQARQMLAQTTDQLKEQASAQTGRAAEGLRTVTDQLRALSTGRPEEAGAVGDYARQVTSKLEELAGRLDDRGFDGIMDDFQRFARRRPGMFLLGAATTGFLAGRFLRGTQAGQSSDDTSVAPAYGVAPTYEAPLVADMDVQRDELYLTAPTDVDVIPEIPDASLGGGRATGAF